MVTRARRNSEAGLGRRILSRWTSRRTPVRYLPGCCSSCSRAAPASAQFAVCNQTLDALNLAVATETNGVFSSEGWWTIGANRCVDVIKDELVSRYIYVYATDVFGQPILASNVAGENMCVGAKRFTIDGTDFMLGARLPVGPLHGGRHAADGAMDAVPERAGAGVTYVAIAAIERAPRPLEQDAQSSEAMTG